MFGCGNLFAMHIIMIVLPIWDIGTQFIDLRNEKRRKKNKKK